LRRVGEQNGGGKAVNKFPCTGKGGGLGTDEEGGQYLVKEQVPKRDERAQGEAEGEEGRKGIADLCTQLKRTNATGQFYYPAVGDWCWRRFTTRGTP